MNTPRIGLYAGQHQLLSLSDKPGFDNSPFPKPLNDQPDRGFEVAVLCDTDPAALARAVERVGVMATLSLRDGGMPLEIPPLDPELAEYFDRGQVR